MDRKTEKHVRKAAAQIEDAMLRLVEGILDDKYQDTVPKKRHQEIVAALRRCTVILEGIIPLLPEEKRIETATYLNAIALTLSGRDMNNG